MKRIFCALVALVASDMARADDVRMDLLTINGLELSGAEYWPYHGAADLNYPADVLWGFYPERGVAPEPGEDPNPDTASVAAVACATEAWKKLKTFMETDQPVLKRIIELGASQGITNKFYLWTNDYKAAASPFPPGLRDHAIWYWLRNPPIAGRNAGYWKWESRVLQDGTCEIPEDAQIEQFLREKLATLEH